MDAEIGDNLLQVGDRRDSEHIGSKRGGIGKSFAIPSQMFTHSPELALSTGRFEPSSMVEQHLEPNVQRRHPRFGFSDKQMLLQNEPRLLFLTKEPGSSQRRSSDQHAIDSGFPHATDDRRW